MLSKLFISEEMIPWAAGTGEKSRRSERGPLVGDVTRQLRKHRQRRGQPVGKWVRAPLSCDMVLTWLQGGSGHLTSRAGLIFLVCPPSRSECSSTEAGSMGMKLFFAQ